MHITLRAGEKLYLNGAVLRANRKVSLELMNDATFLLEAHVMRLEMATTPSRQLYFIVQMMLMNPLDVSAAAELFAGNTERMLAIYTDDGVREAIEQTRSLVAAARYFDALKVLRGVFGRDDVLMGRETELALAS